MTEQPTPESAAPDLDAAAPDLPAPEAAAPHSSAPDSSALNSSAVDSAALDSAASDDAAPDGTDSTGPEAGWYPDPSGAAPLRWWDGSDWVRATHDPAATADDDWRRIPPGPRDPSAPAATSAGPTAARAAADRSSDPPFPDFLPPLPLPEHGQVAPSEPVPYPDLFDGPAQSDEQRRRSRRGLRLALGGIALFVVIAVVAVGVLVNAARTSTLDTAAIETDISGRLSQEAGGAVTVTCPDTVALSTGSTFDCDATGDDGTHVSVVVTQTDDQGNVTWRIGG